jgi:hypothetical protein
MSGPFRIRLAQGEFVEGFASDAVVHASETSIGSLSAALVKDDELGAPFTHELGFIIHLSNGGTNLTWQLVLLQGQL